MINIDLQHSNNINSDSGLVSENDMPLVSIIMPVYNCENFLDESINSVLNQTYSNFELIIINDGSKDNSGSMCDVYSLKDKRIKTIHQNNGGPSSARNKGLDYVNGIYTMFIDSDDSYDTEMIYKMVNAISNEKVDIAICGIKTIQHEKNKTIENNIIMPSESLDGKKEILARLETLFKNRLFNGIYNKIYKTNFIKTKKIRFNETSEMGEDFLFNLNYIEYCSCINIISEALYNYKVDNSNLTKKYRENEFEHRKTNIERLNIFYRQNNYKDKSVDFLYIKLAFACFMQLSHKDNQRTYKENLSYITTILAKKEMIKCLNEIIPRGYTEKFLVAVLNTKSPKVIYWTSIVINFIRTKQLIKWKRISL
ncbi:glycosyltransferase [Paenibacillus sp. PL91]|uniref:glycosyltransferase n=1 Tax=Paenibacillus sp. PL91 TaxID=2729538 RepID=UPI00145F0418|nr:glycosyltransferase [Paenibacillus sp. PL91]MBC9202868.1 glycosyltransferase [Paenibacillus sp. PL91]